MKFSQEIRTETRISNINLKKTEKTRLALKFSQEIRTETRISNFNLKGDLLRNIYVWGGGGNLGGYVPHIFDGGCVPHYTPKNWWGYLGGGGDLFRIIKLKGDVFRIFFLTGDFIQVNRFFILSYPLMILFT